MSKYFSIPHDDLISAPPPTLVTPTGDYHFAHDRLLFWGQADQGSRQVVVLSFEPQGDDTDPSTYIALDGSWSSQLDSCVGGCDGGSGPTPSGVEVLSGGIFQQSTQPTDFSFAAPGIWYPVDGATLSFQAYPVEATKNCSYTADSVVVDRSGWVRVIATITARPYGNDQTYALAAGVNGVAGELTQVRMLNEAGNESESVTIHGSLEVAAGDQISLFAMNVDDVNDLRLFGVNLGVFGVS